MKNSQIIRSFFLTEAPEYKHFLLFYLIPCIDGILPQVYLEHATLLSTGTYLLSKQEILAEDVCGPCWTVFPRLCSSYGSFVRWVLVCTFNFKRMYVSSFSIYNIIKPMLHFPLDSLLIHPTQNSVPLYNYFHEPKLILPRWWASRQYRMLGAYCSQRSQLGGGLWDTLMLEFCRLGDV